MKKRQHAKVKAAPNSRKFRKPSAIITIPLILITLFVIFATTYKIVEFIIEGQPRSTVPSLKISLASVPIEHIIFEGKDEKYPGNTVVFTDSEASTTFSNVEVKGRGNANWNQYKKPFQIKFADKTSLFDFGASKKWVLLSNYLDRSHLRTDTAYYLEHMLSEDYAPNGDFAELYIDDVYYGLYYVSEKIEIDKSRVALQDPFGVIVELDNLHSLNEECVYDNRKNCFVEKDVVNKDHAKVATKNLVDKLSALNLATAQKDFAKISELIDVDSFAKYYLLSEFTVNPDAYSSSFFFYQDGGKVYAGPGWDFDFSLANTLWNVDGLERNSFFSPTTNTALKDYATSYSSDPEKTHANSISSYLYDLLAVPEFSARVKEIYQETMSKKSDELLEHIREKADYIREAALKDQGRWKLETDFDEEVEYLIDWVAKRYDHFEQTYGTSSNPAPESRPPSKE